MQFPASETAAALDTLDAVRAEKARLRAELAGCCDRMKSRCQALCAPGAAEQGGAARWMGHIERVVAVYDGVMFGMKVIRRLRKLRFFGRKR